MAPSKTILLGVVTYDGHAYCFDTFAKALSILQPPDGYRVEWLAVDTSDNLGYADKLREKGFSVLSLGKGKRTRIQKIIDGRNLLREVFLKQGYEFLLFLDSDVMLLPDYLQRLVSLQKDIATGLYLGNVVVQGSQHILPVAYVFYDKEKGLLRQLSQDEVVEEKTIELAACGLGCMLVQHAVLEKLPPFHTLSSGSTGGEDAAFCKDAIAAGFSITCDTGVKCLHMTYPVGDPKNDYFRFKKAAIEYSVNVQIG